ncbi:MAG: chromate efflux transporter [Alphaproteobacteria bacterium]|nr:chromate efflux transporter [Alphaproteobacteria bacterium]
MNDVPSPPHAGAGPGFATALRYWLKLGLIGFGGPAGQIAIMQQDLVERLKWVRAADFQHALNFCMMLPGPEAQQLATYLGWRLHGLKGGIAAGTLFVLPGAVILLGLSWIAAAHGDATWVSRIFTGLKPVVVAVIFAALWRLGRKGLTSKPAIAVAVAAFLSVAWLGLPFPLLVVVAALAGAAAGRAGHGAWFVGGMHGAATPELIRAGAISWRWPTSVAFSYVLLIASLTGLLWWNFGGAFFAPLIWLFTKAAFVTFGGAYAVLPYVADAAVNDLRWLSADQMIDGLALAETTPGPLILVLQYVGFFAGWNDALAQAALGLSPAALGCIAAAVATIATFLPSTCLILMGAPMIGRLGAVPALAAALGAISAAVVGVIANLGLFFAESVLVTSGGVDPWRVGLAVGALALLVRVKLPIHAVIGICALAGLLGIV